MPDTRTIRTILVIFLLATPISLWASWKVGLKQGYGDGYNDAMFLGGTKQQIMEDIATNARIACIFAAGGRLTDPVALDCMQ